VFSFLEFQFMNIVQQSEFVLNVKYKIVNILFMVKLNKTFMWVYLNISTLSQ